MRLNEITQLVRKGKSQMLCRRQSQCDREGYLGVITLQDPLLTKDGSTGQCECLVSITTKIQSAEGQGRPLASSGGVSETKVLRQLLDRPPGAAASRGPCARARRPRATEPHVGCQIVTNQTQVRLLMRSKSQSTDTWLW